VDAGVVSASPTKVIGWSVVAEPHGPSTASPWVSRVGFLYATGLQGYWFPASLRAGAFTLPFGAPVAVPQLRCQNWVHSPAVAALLETPPHPWSPFGDRLPWGLFALIAA
jgi:hypothetical protein